MGSRGRLCCRGVLCRPCMGGNVGFSLASCSAHRSPFAAMGITPSYLRRALPRANSPAQLCLPPCKPTAGSSGPSVGDLGEGGSACAPHRSAPSQIQPGSDATGSDRGHGINVGNLLMKKESPTSRAAGRKGAWGGGCSPGRCCTPGPAQVLRPHCTASLPLPVPVAWRLPAQLHVAPAPSTPPHSGGCQGPVCSPTCPRVIPPLCTGAPRDGGGSQTKGAERARAPGSTEVFGTHCSAPREG